MKIGIVTYWTSPNNYGQILQCFALQEYLRGCGHYPFLIKYSPKERIISRIVRNLSVEKILYLFSKQRATDKRLAKVEQNNYLTADRKFSEFRNSYLNQTEDTYISLKQLRANYPQADMYICGSDQVWGMQLHNEKVAAFYLAFGDKNIKRVAYAASMGGYVPLGGELDTFRSYLDNFDAISLREESTAEFCQSIGYLESKVTLDPTLLLPCEKYLELCKNEVLDINRPFVFAYVLNVQTKEDIYWGSIESYLNNKGLDIKIVYASGYMPARELVSGLKSLQATIPQWLLGINESESVITTSFHGVVFCIKLHKQFLAIMLQGEHSKGNDRIISLLAKLGLSDRIFNPEISVEEQMTQPIDWDEVDAKITMLQQDSIEFLDSCFKM